MTMLGMDNSPMGGMRPQMRGQQQAQPRPQMGRNQGLGPSMQGMGQMMGGMMGQGQQQKPQMPMQGRGQMPTPYAWPGGMPPQQQQGPMMHDMRYRGPMGQGQGNTGYEGGLGPQMGGGFQQMMQQLMQRGGMPPQGMPQRDPNQASVIAGPDSQAMMQHRQRQMQPQY